MGIAPVQGQGQGRAQAQGQGRAGAWASPMPSNEMRASLASTETDILIKELEGRDLNEAWRSPHLEPLLRKLKASLGGPPAPQ